jgi:hypothetical protein
MIEPTLPDPDQIVATVLERHQHMLMAGRKATLDALHVCAQTANAFADSQEKLAAMSEVEWLSRLLRAQAGFTREMLDASAKFTRELMEEE